MNKTNNNNITFSPFVGAEGGSINNSLSKGEGRGEVFYIAPAIRIIKDVYNEGLMTNLWSTGIGTGTPGTGVQPAAKPGGDWGNAWDDPEAVHDDSWRI